MNWDEERSLVHLEGPLPAGVTELVFLPTFHEPLGVRLRGAEVELWTGDEVVALVVEREVAERFEKAIAACVAGPAPDGPGGRDGLLLLVRAPQEVVCWTTSGEHAWLEFGREFLSVVASHASLPAPVKKIITDLSPYLERRPPSPRRGRGSG